MITVGKTAGPAQQLPRQKILLCAPSNAAIDEVAKRLMEGVCDSEGRQVVPNIVRVGADKAINVSVKEVSIDFLVDQKLGSEKSASDLQDVNNEIGVLRADLVKVKELKQAKQDELARIHDNSTKVMALEEEIKSLNSRRIGLSQQLDRLRDKQKSENRSLDAIRRKCRQKILVDADVICSTLSGAGHEQLDQFDFAMVVIDEAAQAIELSSLIPLKYRCNQCVMVGGERNLL